MNTLRSLLLLVAAAATPAFSQGNHDSPFAGRWDLTIKTTTETYPSWIEFSENSGRPAVRIVGRVSSVHPASDVNVKGSQLSFTSSEWFGKPTKVTWTFTEANGKLNGAQKREDGTVGHIVGVPAPALHRPAPTAWTKPEPLFNGKSLAGWVPMDSPDNAGNHWVAENGDLLNQSPGANLRTTRKFNDFKLHMEYNCPKDGNSGIYLRGRYEVQVAYEAPGKNDKFHGMGAVYGFLAPSVELPDKPGQWETFDITLVGRNVTVVRDGTTTIDNQEIPGITGGALDSHEAEPNYVYIQGDHTGGMKYRNITISVPRH